MSTKRRRGRKNWWQTSNHGMKNWVSATLIGALAIGASSLAGLALTREAPTGTAAAGSQPTSLASARCEPGDQIHPTDQVNQQIASLIRGEIGDICS